MSCWLHIVVTTVVGHFLVVLAVPETCVAGSVECDGCVSENQVETVEESMTEDMRFQLLQAGQSIKNNEDASRPKHAAFKAKHRRKKVVQVSSDAEIDLSETEPRKNHTSDDSTTRLVSPVTGMSNRAARAIATQRKLEERHRTAQKMLASKLAKQQAANRARQELAASRQSLQEMQQGQIPQVMQMPFGYASGMQMLPGMQVLPMNVPSSMSSFGPQQMPAVMAMAPMQPGYQQTMPQVGYQQTMPQVGYQQRMPQVGYQQRMPQVGYQQTMPQVMQTIPLQDGTQAFMPQMMPQQMAPDLSQAPPIADYEITSERHSHGKQGRMYSQQMRTDAQEDLRQHAFKRRSVQKLQASKRWERQTNQHKPGAMDNELDQMTAPMQYVPWSMEVPASLAQTRGEVKKVTQESEVSKSGQTEEDAEKDSVVAPGDEEMPSPSSE